MPTEVSQKELKEENYLGGYWLAVALMLDIILSVHRNVTLHIPETKRDNKEGQIRESLC